jgi:hypothetical protein
MPTMFAAYGACKPTMASQSDSRTAVMAILAGGLIFAGQAGEQDQREGRNRVTRWPRERLRRFSAARVWA